MRRQSRLRFRNGLPDSLSRFRPYCHYGLLLAMLLVSFWVRLMLLRNAPMHSDELYEAREHVSQSVAYNFSNFRLDGHLLHTLISKPFSYIGWEPYILRWSSLVVGILCLPLAYHLGRQLFDKRTALIIGAMIAVWTPLVESSIYLRSYSLMVFLSLVSSNALFYALRSGKIYGWLILSIACILAMFAHLFSALYLAPVFLFLIWWLMCNPQRISPQERAKTLRGALMALLLIGIGVLVIAGFIFQSHSTVGNLQQLLTDGVETDFTPLQLSELSELLYPYWKMLRHASFSQENRWHHVLFCILLLFGTAISLMDKPRSSGVYLALLAIVPIVLVTLLQTLITSGFRAFVHYLDFALYAYVFFVACAISRISHRISGNKHLLGTVVILAVLGILLVPAYSELKPQYADGENQQMAKVAEYLQKHTEPNDLILCVRRDDSDTRLLREKCVLGLHFYPQLAPKTFSWQRLDNHRIWQMLIMPDLKCNSHFFTVPDRRLEVSCESGHGNGPNIWLVFWQQQGLQFPYASTLSSPSAEFGNTRIVHIFDSEDLWLNLKRAGDLILSDDVSTEWLARNSVVMANMYASMADLPSASSILESIDISGADDQLSQNVRELRNYLPFLDGPPFPAVSSNATWDSQIQLVGFSVHSDYRDKQSEKLKITLFWQALRPIQKDYTFFIQCWDKKNQNIAQVDYRPYDGLLPTNQWLPGEIIRETRTMSTPNQRLAESCRLVLGIYDLQTMERLALSGDRSSQNVLELAEW